MTSPRATSAAAPAGAAPTTERINSNTVTLADESVHLLGGFTGRLFQKCCSGWFHKVSRHYSILGSFWALLSGFTANMCGFDFIDYEYEY